MCAGLGGKSTDTSSWDVTGGSSEKTFWHQRSNGGVVARGLFPSFRRSLSWAQACSPPSCGSYDSKAILGSNVLAVFHVISPA